MLWYQFIPFRKSNQGCPQLFDNLSVGTDVYSIKLHGLAGYLSILLNQQGSHSFECEILQNIGSMLDMVDVRILRDRLSGHFNNFFKSCKSRIATVISGDRKSTRLNSSHVAISYAVFCLKKKRKNTETNQHDR